MGILPSFEASPPIAFIIHVQPKKGKSQQHGGPISAVYDMPPSSLDIAACLPCIQIAAGRRHASLPAQKTENG